MAQYEFIIYEPEHEDGIARLTLNRPEVLNAFHLPMVDEINEALRDAENDDKVVCVVLRGAGRAFCVGRDFKYSGELQKQDSAGWHAWRTRFQSPGRTLWRHKKATIAQVHGYAVGGGQSLAVEADITYAAEGTKFGYPDVKFGMVSMSPHIYNFTMGAKKTKEYLFTGRFIDAKEAYDFHLINQVLAADRLEDEVMNLAREIVTIERRHPGQMQCMKFQINRCHPDILEGTDQYTAYGHQAERKYIADMIDIQSGYFDLAGEKGARAMIDAMGRGQA